MITDIKGNQWETRLSYRMIKAIAAWKVASIQLSPPDEAGNRKEIVTSRDLGVDVTNIASLAELSLEISDKFEVVAAWLWPQWVPKMTRDEFDDLLTPEFVNAAITELEVQARSFFTGPVGTMGLEEIDRFVVEFAEKVRPELAAHLRRNLMPAGKSMPESSALAVTLTT